MGTVLGMSPLLALVIGMFMLLVGNLLIDRRPTTMVVYIPADTTYDRRSKGWAPLVFVISLILLLLYIMG